MNFLVVYYCWTRWFGWHVSDRISFEAKRKTRERERERSFFIC